MNPLTLRVAVAADASAISELINSLMPYMTLHPDARGAEEFIQGMAVPAIESYVTAPNYFYQMGLVDGELAGVIAMRDGSHVFHMFVAEKYQGRGVARQMWQAASEHALRTGNRAGFTVNASRIAVPVYRRFGFFTVGALIEQHGIAYQPMRMRP